MTSSKTERFGNLKETIRRSGLTRWQLVYLEERRLIGAVKRSGRRRVYADDQVEYLEELGLIRSTLGLGLDDAAEIASAFRGGPPPADLERIEDLASRSMAASERHAKIAQRLVRLVRRAKSGETGTSPW